MSLKIGYILSDTTERTGFQVVPGTQLGVGVRDGMIDLGGGRLWDTRQGNPPGAMSLPLKRGDAVVFDRRVVHSSPHNPLVGEGLRKALFFGYSYRWLRPRDENSGLEKYALHKTCSVVAFEESLQARRDSACVGCLLYTSPSPRDS